MYIGPIVYIAEGASKSGDHVMNALVLHINTR